MEGEAKESKAVAEELVLLGNYGEAPKGLITGVISVLKATKNDKTFNETYEDFNKKINALIKGEQKDINYLIKVTTKGFARTPQMSFPFALLGLSNLVGNIMSSSVNSTRSFRT